MPTPGVPGVGPIRDDCKELRGGLGDAVAGFARRGARGLVRPRGATAGTIEFHPNPSGDTVDTVRAPGEIGPGEIGQR